MLDQFDDICKGVDQCPTEAGPDWAKGCPMDNPDADGDSLCAPWVFEKSMYEQFKDICPTKTADKCPAEAGPAWNKGCAFDDDPDPDGDRVCSEWVATKKLQKQFANVCTGIDRCPDEPGDDGHGCPVQAPEKLTGVTFKSGKATLESNAKTVLKGVAKKLTTEDRYKDLKIVIQGHTDNQGKAKKNMDLSKARAKAVADLLVKSGVDRKRIDYVGCGDTAPVADNKTADGREENRRIEMHYVTPDDDGKKCVATFTE
jgi:outer membrane protein OmpA-like peptidoglycan-associated protein